MSNDDRFSYSIGADEDFTEELQDNILKQCKAAWEAPSKEIAHLMLGVLQGGREAGCYKLQDGRAVSFQLFKPPEQTETDPCVFFIDARIFASLGDFRRGEEPLMHQEWRIDLRGGGAAPTEEMMAAAMAPEGAPH